MILLMMVLLLLVGFKEELFQAMIGFLHEHPAIHLDGSSDDSPSWASPILHISQEPSPERTGGGIACNAPFLLSFKELPRLLSTLLLIMGTFPHMLGFVNERENSEVRLLNLWRLTLLMILLISLMPFLLKLAMLLMADMQL